MKFECLNPECKKQFEYAAKQTVFNPETTTDFETHVCPYCQSLNIQEVIEEPKVKGKITALIEVPNAEVNARLAEGYEVLEDKIYSKSTILVKREKILKETL